MGTRGYCKSYRGAFEMYRMLQKHLTVFDFKSQLARYAALPY
jgi:hypothetical protein